MAFGINLFTTDGIVDSDVLKAGRLIDAKAIRNSTNGSVQMSSECVSSDVFYYQLVTDGVPPRISFNNSTKVLSYDSRLSGTPIPPQYRQNSCKNFNIVCVRFP